MLVALTSTACAEDIKESRFYIAGKSAGTHNVAILAHIMESAIWLSTLQ